MLLSPKVGGVDLNINAANHVILPMPEWCPADDERAIARAWRMPQPLDVHVWRVVATHSMDWRVEDRVTVKVSKAYGLLDVYNVNAEELSPFDRSFCEKNSGSNREDKELRCWEVL